MRLRDSRFVGVLKEAPAQARAPWCHWPRDASLRRAARSLNYYYYDYYYFFIVVSASSSIHVLYGTKLTRLLTAYNLLGAYRNTTLAWSWT